jgi:hypothetical protein
MLEEESMDSNIAGIILVLLILVVPFILTRLSKKQQNKDTETESVTEEISFWSIQEETSNRLVFKIESTDTIFTFDIELGIITCSDNQWKEMPNPGELPVSEVEKLLLSFEDAPTGIDPYAKLALVTTHGEKFQIIKGYRYIEVVSPIARKIADFIHKGIEEEILAAGTFWKEAG